MNIPRLYKIAAQYSFGGIPRLNTASGQSFTTNRNVRVKQTRPNTPPFSSPKQTTAATQPKAAPGTTRKKSKRTVNRKQQAQSTKFVYGTGKDRYGNTIHFNKDGDPLNGTGTYNNLTVTFKDGRIVTQPQTQVTSKAQPIQSKAYLQPAYKYGPTETTSYNQTLVQILPNNPKTLYQQYLDINKDIYSLVPQLALILKNRADLRMKKRIAVLRLFKPTEAFKSTLDSDLGVWDKTKLTAKNVAAIANPLNWF